MTRLLTAPLLLFALTTAVASADEWDLQNPPHSPTAKRKREKALELWKELEPVFEKVKSKKVEEIAPEDATTACEKIEKFVMIVERELRREWNADANLALCDAVRTWYALRPRLPEVQLPTDEKERKKAEALVAKEHREQLKSARKLIMDYGSRRRHDKLLNRCPTCEGRLDIRNAFGDKHPCPTCKRKGRLVDREGVVEARWLVHSPLYRADTRRQVEVNRILRLAGHDFKRLAPFVRSVAIDGDIEDHGVWIRVRTKEKIYPEPESKRTERVKRTYTLYRVGKVWYFYHFRYDSGLVEIPELPEDEEGNR